MFNAHFAFMQNIMSVCSVVGCCVLGTASGLFTHMPRNFFVRLKINRATG